MPVPELSALNASFHFIFLQTSVRWELLFHFTDQEAEVKHLCPRVSAGKGR